MDQFENFRSKCWFIPLMWSQTKFVQVVQNISYDHQCFMEKEIIEYE